MKPPPFEYAAPRDIEGALALGHNGEMDVRYLAGGQSLVPAMNFRMARPSLLVDLNRIPGLRGIRRTADGGLSAGAMTRHADFEHSDLVRESQPLLHAAMPDIAHMAIRTRGTIGGSLAHADPAADWPALCLACNASIRTISSGGERRFGAGEFSTGLFSTALESGEMISEISFPAWPVERGWALNKMTRRHGDFAIVGVIATVDLDRSGVCDEARIVLYGVDDRPRLARASSDVLAGKKPGPDTIRRAAQQASRDIAGRSDLHASSEYRLELIEVLTRRSLESAFARHLA